MLHERTPSRPAAPLLTGSPGRRDKTRGQSMVEFTLMLPLILVLAIGILEFGMLFKDHMGIHYASRAGVRVGVEASKLPEADCDILRAVSTTMTTMDFTRIVRVDIYRADNADGTCTSPCTANIYIPTNPRPPDGPDCDANYQPHGWSPYQGTNLPYPATSRGNTEDPQHGQVPDSLGVAVEYTHNFFFNYVPGADSTSIVIRDPTVMQIEPEQFRPIPP